MSISFTCPSCEKSFTAKDSAAGTTFRCKDCDATVTVPASEPESDAYDVAQAVEVETPLPPRQRRVAAPSPIPERAAREPVARTVPPTLIIVMLLECLLIAFNGFNLVSELSDDNPNLRGMVVIFIRIVLEVAVIIGLWQGRYIARKFAMVLCGLGLGMMIICGGATLLLAGQAQIGIQPGGNKVFTLLILGFQFVLFAAELILLMTDSATDFCDR